MNNQHNNNPFHNNNQQSTFPNSNNPFGQQQGAQGQENNTNQQGPKPVVSLPKGGGAIKSIGEKFETNPVNGTYSMSVPIAISPGRGGFNPQLALSYNSGSGNSPFGLGWDVGVPSITRKTDKSLPRYLDASDSDTYILSGAEDLVPVDGGEDTTHADYIIKRYQPRTEGLFARIERWTNKTTGRIHWRSISKENITSIYGSTDATCVIDPNNSKRIFSWNLEKSYDAKGNLMEYTYKKEDNIGINISDIKREATQTYLKEIKYGNTVMCDANGAVTGNSWFFRLVFDYGEHDANNPSITATQDWPVRQDAFSSFRAGFDIRTYRLCRRVLMFHNFGATELVKATEFQYNENPFLAQLTKVTHRSYDGAASETLPPVSFEYTDAPTGTRIHKVDPKYLSNVPHGTGSTWQWTDLYGEGLQSLLHTSNNAWYLKRNLGDQSMLVDAAEGENPVPELKLGGLQLLREAPHISNQNGMSFHLSDVDSDSQPEVVVNSPQMNGYYSFENNQWKAFRSFRQYPNIDLNNPNTKMMELSGDGLADIIVSHGTHFDIYLSEGKNGYKEPMRISTASTEEAGAKVIFADPQNSIHLADMTGDGLADIVRIRHSSVCYWPNLGYGKFGKKVIMRNVPLLDSPDLFNNLRIRLADVDGTGTSDIIYFNHEGAKFYKNQAGNAFSEAEKISSFPWVNNQAQVEVMDLLGNGTSCMIWTSQLPSHSEDMYYIELTSGKKPYLLKRFTNGMGKETKLSYAPSTQFYLRDKNNGTPWISKLPFPVQVLTRVETIEHVTGTKLVSRFAYHHGHYDTKEREFRGFGMVEQWDAEELTTDNQYNQAPAYTKSWFHTGFYNNRNEISTQYQAEYFSNDWVLPDTVLPSGITADQEAEACRALRGSLLRSEVYAQDGSSKASIPYIVEEKNYQLKLIQPKGSNRHAIWLKTEGQALSFHYERDETDPRIQHALTLDTDNYGNITQSAQIAYPRRSNPNITIEPEQQQLHVICTEIKYINIESTSHHRIGIPYETQQFEVTGLSQPSEGGNDIAFKLDALKNAINDPSTAEIDYAATPSSGVQKRCFAHQRTYFYNQSLTAKLNLGQIATHGMPYHQLQADITAALLTALQQTRPEITATMLTTEGKYELEDSIYWVASGKVEPDANKFYLPKKNIDALGNETILTYDGYALFPINVKDALGNDTSAIYDYRVLQAKEITNPNMNKQAAKFNTLGMISAQAVIGSAGEGDTLQSPSIEYNYNLNNFIDNQLPIYVHVKKRTQHAVSNFEESYVYSGGNGNMVMTKVQAEPHPDTPSTARWVGTGRTIYNNKGKAVKQYEPYFSNTHAYETNNINGVTPIIYYDPVGRNIKTEHPDGTLERVSFNPWEQKTYDRNDTVLDAGNSWYADASSSDPAKQRAASLAAAHANSPQTQYLDSLGRPFITEDDNKADGKYRVHQTLDIAGRPTIITDAKDRPMTSLLMGMQQALKTSNIDSGTREQINDVAGKPMYIWDSRGHQLKHTYDALQRPLLVYLCPNHEVISGSQCPQCLSGNIIVEKTIYGNDASKNNIGLVYEQFDQSGKQTVVNYDFKGNPLKVQKQFCVDYKNNINWAATPSLQAEVFEQQITYDALNRPLTETLPNSELISRTYNEAGLLETVAKGADTYVSNINYNEKGQRTKIEFGNGSKTKYEYDTHTFRLSRLLTTGNMGVILQDISYIYDPVGNIIEMEDSAHETSYYKNAPLEPKRQFTYDAMYRLKSGDGRELIGLAKATSGGYPTDSASAADKQAVHKYTQQYTYDELGNILSMVHAAGSQPSYNWTRNYQYDTATNRLLKHDSTQTEDDYSYDAHGNITSMPHLSTMDWDYTDMLIKTTKGTESTYYRYDAGGERVRKITEKQNGTKIERLYMGGYEVYRELVEQSGTYSTQKERTTVHISDDKKRIAMVEALTISGGTAVSNTTECVRYQIDDHLGSASLELDENAAIISYEEYHSFGTTSYQKHNTDISQKRYKYVGKERDDETGLYYYGARYYAAWIARFVSVDPLQNSQKNIVYSPYHYARNNPINYNDPTGMEWDPTNDTQGKADYFRKETTKLINKVNTKLIETENRMKGMDDSRSKYTELKDLKVDLKERLIELNNALDELDAMENDPDQIYRLETFRIEQAGTTTIKYENGKGFTENPDKGKIFYNLETGVVTMKYSHMNLESMAHELKHGFQFKSGELSFSRNTGKQGAAYDAIDEVEAWNRGALYSQSVKKPLKKKKVSDVEDMGYTFKSSTPLNINNTLNEIFTSTGRPTISDPQYNETLKKSNIDITR